MWLTKLGNSPRPSVANSRCVRPAAHGCPMINNGSWRQEDDNRRARRERNYFAQRGGSEVVRQDHLKDQRIGSRRKAMADAKLDAHRIGLTTTAKSVCCYRASGSKWLSWP